MEKKTANWLAKGILEYQSDLKAISVLISEAKTKIGGLEKEKEACLKSLEELNGLLNEKHEVIGSVIPHPYPAEPAIRISRRHHS